MRTRSQILATAAALAALLALPAASSAEYYVPPENSAANQYTESFPGAGGESSGKRKEVKPGTALGAGNAKRLEEQGPDGKAAAELAADTAPSQVAAGSGESSGGGNDGPSKIDEGSGGSGSGSGSGEATGGGGGSSSSGGDGGNGNGAAGKQAAGEAEGSSGFGQVLGQATGAGDGGLGIWLPLAIVLMLIGSVAYWVRMRHAQTGHSV